LTKLAEIYDALDLLTAGKPVDVEQILKDYGVGRSEEQLSLMAEVGRQYDRAKEASLTRAELAEYHPEAIVPRRKEGKEPLLSSDITDSPVYKRAGSEEAAVEDFAERFVKYVEPWKKTQAFADGAKWYSDFSPRLKKAFGGWAERFAQLLAATSPQTNPQVNFGYAYDALRSWQDGRFDKIAKKFSDGMNKIADGSWEPWIAKEIKAGEVPDPPGAPTAATFLAHWVAKYDLKPKQTNGKLYGQHSESVLKVFVNQWFETAGPKTQNFVKNLLATGEEATVDLWADRTMRRLGYEGEVDRWRILPRNQAGVRDVDFAFSQKVFRAAAKKLGMRPSDLQGAAWFAEKMQWALSGWSGLDLGDYRKEMGKLPYLEQGYQQRVGAKKRAKRAPEAKQEELFGLVEPRKP
jgi:hypothetical protein